MTAVLTSLFALALLLFLAWLWHRGTRVADGDDAWLRILGGVLLIGVSALVTAGIGIFTGSGTSPLSSTRSLVFSGGDFIACALIYLGLIKWNRARTGIVDPGESLNGLSAVFVLVGIGNLIAPQLRDPPIGLEQWQLQATLWVCAGLIVLLGTAISVAFLGGLVADLRLWLILAALSAATCAEVTGPLSSDDARPQTQALWLAGAALLSICVFVTPADGRPKAANSQATIVGSLVVLLAGAGVLAADNSWPSEGDHLATGYALAGVFGGTLRVIRLVQDLSQLAQSRHEAMTDELTGIANRRALLNAIDKALKTARSTSLLIIDLDRFKAINDRYGHAAGDLLLRHMVEAFAEQLPRDGLLARLGGDEFAVLLTNTPAEQAALIAESLAQAAAPLSDVKGRLLQVGASVGVATVHTRGVSGGELLRRADAAMYRAKMSGSGVRVYDSALDAAAQERLGLIEDLHFALEGPPMEREQILVYFQPQLNLATGAIVGAEALVRWMHPELGLLTPDKFIDLAEQNELMPSLTRRVMLEATAEAARWLAVGHHLRVSVNLSASCLGHPDLLVLIDEVLSHGMLPKDLVLEVTETSLMTEPEAALKGLKRLAERGVGISIDDYGTGYSSLSYLNDLPATELKIDRSFTRRVRSDPRTAAIVAGTVELAHRLGMRLVVEGVEDETTLAVMSQLGCDESQGYLHSRPLPAALFLHWLRLRTPIRSAETANPAGQPASEDRSARTVGGAVARM